MSQLDIFRFEMFRDMPALRYGIFGRSGGVSPAPFDSLNVGASVGDASENVRRNLVLACTSLGVRYADLVNVRQVHSNLVRRVTASDRGRRVGELDGMFTDEQDVPLILRFADCVPLLAYDSTRGVLGVAHAGWRGTVSKIGTRLVTAMGEEFGCRPADLAVGIGPSIGPCCYEVGAEVIAATRSAFGPTSDRLLIPSDDGGIHLDLWEANRVQLEAAGVERVETAGICTACHKERFFSYRGSNGVTGRFPLIAFIHGGM